MSNQNTFAKKRLYWIDNTKGLAILGIILFHFFQNYPDGSQLVSVIARNGARIGYGAVDIFFVIAGFNISYPFLLKSNPIKVDWKIWLKKRLIRLYPTYWLAIVFTLILSVLFATIRINSFLDFTLIFIGFPGYIRFKTINPGFWFFSVILQAYFLVPLIFYISKSQPKRILLLGILGGAITKMTCWLFSFQNPGLFLFLLQNNFVGSYFFPFCLGIYWGFIYFKYQDFRLMDWIVSTIVFAFGLVIYASFLASGIDIPYMLGFDAMFTPFFLLLCYWICQKIIYKISIINNFLNRLGTDSYQIYLIHQPLLFIILPFLINKLAIPVDIRLGLALILFNFLLVFYVLLFNQSDLFIRSKTVKLFNLLV